MVAESWPPRDADEMLALQNRYGNDVEIANVVNLTRNAVAAARWKLGVGPYKPKNFWTETNCERLAELWGKGWSANQIALEMGCSRNAVIGKAHRLGLPSRPSPINHTTGKHSRSQRRKKQDAKALLNLNREPPKEPGHGRIDGVQPYQADVGPVMDCQWIEGAPGTPVCGKRSRPGKPYCAEHCERAYLPLKRKEAA